VSKKRAALRSAVEADKQAREDGIATAPSNAEQLTFLAEEAINSGAQAQDLQAAEGDVKTYQPTPKPEH
ncbi:MAG: hypothetical protein RRY54_05670, partial [Angelakisella sp.]